MIPPAFTYVKATSVDEAIGLAAEHGEDAKYLAGGQSLLPLMKLRFAAPTVLIDLGRVTELSYIRDEGSYVHFRTDTWRDTYAKRADKILAALTGAGLKVIWCGNPIARSQTYSDDMKYINDIYAAEVAKFGGEFLPLWTIIANDHGQFTAYGLDRSGVTERLRNDDGIHFTAAGYELIAERVLSVLPSLQANGR